MIGRKTSGATQARLKLAGLAERGQGVFCQRSFILVHESGAVEAWRGSKDRKTAELRHVFSTVKEGNEWLRRERNLDANSAQCGHTACWESAISAGDGRRVVCTIVEGGDR
jgi:hypothetical protein